VAGGFRLDGQAPWITGWGLIDTLLVAARDEHDTAMWLLVDAAEAPTLTVEPLRMIAVTASRTVHARFDAHLVAADRVTSTLPFAEWPARDAAGLRLNGSLALGVADRCRRLISGDLADGFAAEIDACRVDLDAADPLTMPAARAAAADLALRAASTAVVSAGARGILAGEPAQRLLREAGFLLVFGSRPGIRTELLRRVSGAPVPATQGN
jgi:alkylation response protein AidB-like acyl-CoA dehydrogenase